MTKRDTYPTEVIACAEYEIRTFERPSADTSKSLLAEVKAWRERFPQYEYRAQDDCVALK